MNREPENPSRKFGLPRNDDGILNDHLFRLHPRDLSVLSLLYSFIFKNSKIIDSRVDSRKDETCNILHIENSRRVRFLTP